MTYDKKTLENIKNYSNEIKTIESLRDIIRKRPGRYIGGRGNVGFLNSHREVGQNAIDEMVKRKSPCNHIWIYFDEATLESTVGDNGRGIPVNKIIDIFTSDRTSSNYEKEKGDYSAGTHGTGATITNALSEYFIVESNILGESYKVEFDNFYPKTKKPVKQKASYSKQGTYITFKPSIEVMGEITVTGEMLLNMYKSLIILTDIGSVIDFEYKDKKGNIHKEVIKNTDGLLPILVNMTQEPIVEPIHIYADNGEIRSDILFTFAGDMNDRHIISYSNFCYTQYGGTHEKGTLAGIVKFFKEMDKIKYGSKNAKNKNKIVVSAADIESSLYCVVNTALLQPEFTSQAKDALGNEFVVPYLRDLVYNFLTEYFKTRVKELEDICELNRQVAQLRLKINKAKIDISKAIKTNSITGLPENYDKPIIMENAEFIIVEGDSAAGNAKNRKMSNQGIFKIRGKLPNALQTVKSKLLANKEIAGIITCLGCGYGKNFDITKLKYKRIIIMCDADSDGAHIATLVIIFIMMYMPQLIEGGYVYKAIPPLYGFKKGKEMQYITNKTDYISYLQQEFSKKYQLNYVNDTPLSMEDIKTLLSENEEYGYRMKDASNMCAVEPTLLEKIIINIDKPAQEIVNILKREEQYRYLKLDEINGVKIIKGLVGNTDYLIPLNEMFKHNCSVIYYYIHDMHNCNIMYKLNGKYISLYTVLELFDSIAPKDLQRYKGLGEMDYEELYVSTLLESSNRYLVRYTADNINDEINTIKAYNTDKEKIVNEISSFSRSITM